VTVLAGGGWLAGCNDGPGKPADVPTRGAGATSATPVSVSPSPSPSPSSVTPTGTVEEQILAQYRKFWTEALPAASAAPAAQRRAILSPVAGEPALSRLLGVMSKLDAEGKRAYGRMISLQPTVQRGGAVALVRSCFDSSGSGELDIKTGRKLTVGPKRELILTTLKRSPDGSWRVTSIGQPKDSSC